MPLLSWFSYSSTETDAVKNDQNDESGQLTATATNQQPMDFDAIVERVEAMKSELAYAHELCEQANLQFEKYRLDIQELKQSLSIERRSNAVLKETLNVERKNCAALRVQANVDKQEIKRQKVITTQLQARLSTEIASLKAMTQHARTIEQRYAEAQFDLEYLKCITDADRLMQSPTTENKDAPLPALPFVVVLVDGDAYSVRFLNDYVEGVLSDLF